MSPSQLEHKRAHDREAQRANRRRVKDRIVRLEKELEEKRGNIGSSRVYQELLRRNRLLEDEVAKLKNSLAASSSSGMSPASSSPGSIPEGSGFIDYRTTTDELPYSNSEVYNYLMSNSDFSGLEAEAQHGQPAIYKDNQQLHVSLDGLDHRTSPSFYKASSNYTPESSGTGIYQHVNNYVIPVCDVDTSTIKPGPVHNGLHVQSGSWSMGQLHDTARSDSHCGLHTQGVGSSTGWKNGPTQKAEMRYYPAGGAYFTGSSPGSHHSSGYCTGNNTNNLGLAHHHGCKSACI